MTCSAEMGVAESHDRGVVVTVSGAGLIDHRLVLSVDIMRNRIGVWTQLDSSERHASSRESVTHSVCAYERIDIAGVILSEDGQTSK